MLLSDFIKCVPHNQNIVVLIVNIEIYKLLDTIQEYCIDISKYQFDNIEHIIISPMYDEYKDYYIDYIFAYRDTLYIYIIDRG